MTYCEDAPCCGCCTPAAMGWYDDPRDSYDDYYDRDYDVDHEVDPADCDHGDCSWSEQDGTAECDLCYTEGVCFPVMGEYVVRFPVTKVTSYEGGGEDAHLDGSYES